MSFVLNLSLFIYEETMDSLEFRFTLEHRTRERREGEAGIAGGLMQLGSKKNPK